MTESTQNPITDYDKTSLSVDEAVENILSHVKCIESDELLPIRDCIGRILAADVVSPINVPPHVNSAMDGYAYKHTDSITKSNNHYKIIGTAFAGKPFDAKVGSDEAVRIMTGGVIPENTDTVVIQENTSVFENTLEIIKKPKLGENVRLTGEDIKINETVLQKGRKITVADLGLIASLGMGELKVHKRPKVVFFSTGDELKSIGSKLRPGDIYDSNRYTLFGMLKKANVDLIDMGVVKDTYEGIKAALVDAKTKADVIITSGGVSVGEADYIKDVLANIGKVKFWKVSMKPGRPLAFGSIGNAHFFGLPGNPVSVMVGFHQFVAPALTKLSGADYSRPLHITAIANEPIRKRPGRTEFQRGIMSQGADDQLLVKPTGDQGSGILMSMSRSNCFIVLPLESSDIKAGSSVAIIPFNEFL